MIPQYVIDAWKKSAPWQSAYQVEQDLIICRAIIEIFTHPDLKNAVAFRGGTALHKIFNLAEARYSEDIDLVVCQEGPVGHLFDSIQKVLNPWLGKPRRVLKENRANLMYRFATEDLTVPSAKLKVEINTVENICVDGYKTVNFSHSSDWFDGTAEVLTFSLNELLATKLRALYQRKKGRDLFDLYFGLKSAEADAAKIATIFSHYMDFTRCRVSRAQFEENMHGKIKDPIFRDDISALLINERDFDLDKAYAEVMTNLIAQLPGEPWRGE